MPNPKEGGRYLKATPDSEPVFVSGTDRKQTESERKKVDKILNKNSSSSRSSADSAAE